MGNFLGAIAQILDIALTVYMWIIILSALISWVNPDPNNPIVQFLRKASEPVLRPIRNMMGLRLTVDLSPIIAILIILFLQSFVVRTLAQMGHRMQ